MKTDIQEPKWRKIKCEDNFGKVKNVNKIEVPRAFFDSVFCETATTWDKFIFMVILFQSKKTSSVSVSAS